LEILSTEKFYVENLKLVIEGLAIPCEKDERIPFSELHTIFGHLKAIFAINSKLLDELQSRYPENAYDEKTCIADIFVDLAPFFLNLTDNIVQILKKQMKLQ